MAESLPGHRRHIVAISIISIIRWAFHSSHLFHHTFISLHIAFVHYPLASRCFRRGFREAGPEQVVIVPWSPELCMLRHLFKMRVPLVVPELSLLRNLVHVANMRLMPYPYNACLDTSSGAREPQNSAILGNFVNMMTCWGWNIGRVNCLSMRLQWELLGSKTMAELMNQGFLWCLECFISSSLI